MSAVWIQQQHNKFMWEDVCKLTEYPSDVLDTLTWYRETHPDRVYRVVKVKEEYE